MCPNRVEELESRVQELEASVEGLTDELIECKVRIRELENAVDADLGFVPAGEESDDSPTEADTSVEETKTQAADKEDKTEEYDDIIVA